MSRPRATLLVSLDVEEDNWRASRSNVTVENIRELPRLARLFEKLGIRPTYFVTFQVMIHPTAMGLLRATAKARGEVGAHLHPWNTPPIDAGSVAPTMLLNYPYEQQLAKIRRLTEVGTAAMGKRPTLFRAGRFGLGPKTVTALLESGYHADSSVTPYFSWRESHNGPDFTGAPVRVYALGRDSDPRAPDPDGRLLEVPITAGFTRLGLSRWPLCARLLGSWPVQRSGVAGLAARTELVRKLMLSPETNSVRQMLALSRRLVRAGGTPLHLFLHSSSLRAGLTPFTRTDRDVDNLYGRIEGYVEALATEVDLSFATIGEIVAAERIARGLERVGSDDPEAHAAI